MRVIRPEALVRGRAPAADAARAGDVRQPASLALELDRPARRRARLASAMAGGRCGSGPGNRHRLAGSRPAPGRPLGGRAMRLRPLLAPTFDDNYTLVVAPRLPVRDSGRLDGILVGPAGVRVLTARDWEGRYRVRGRVWEFDAHADAGGSAAARTRATTPSPSARAWRAGREMPACPTFPSAPAIVFPRSALTGRARGAGRTRS